MSEDKSSQKAFEDARDAREHDIWRAPPETQAQIEDLEQRASAEMERLRTEQEIRRTNDLAIERAHILREHPSPAHIPDGASTRHVPDSETLDRMAAHAVDRRYAQEIESVVIETYIEIDALLRDFDQKRPNEPENESTQEFSSVLDARPGIGDAFTRAADPTPDREL